MAMTPPLIIGSRRERKIARQLEKEGIAPTNRNINQRVRENRAAREKEQREVIDRTTVENLNAAVQIDDTSDVFEASKVNDWNNLQPNEIAMIKNDTHRLWRYFNSLNNPEKARKLLNTLINKHGLNDFRRYLPDFQD